MTFKQKLECLRGEPIVEKADVESVPCRETSDADHLCKHPVVSVHMLAYNHAKFIRKAIDGVLMQKTDFEYELIIGEDASTDETREICFDYQRRFPDKVRVLWSEQNVNGMGGSAARVFKHCRGEFIAFCEGDDYWTEPTKLQCQVEAFRANPSVGLCANDYVRLVDATGSVLANESPCGRSGLIRGMDYVDAVALHRYPKDYALTGRPFQTAGVMIRKTALDKAQRRFPELWRWKLRFEDILWFETVAAVSDLYLIPTVMSVYRLNVGSAVFRDNPRLILDGYVFQIKLLNDIYGLSFEKALKFHFRGSFIQWSLIVRGGTRNSQKEWAKRIRSDPVLWGIFERLICRPHFWMLAAGMYGDRVAWQMVRVFVLILRLKDRWMPRKRGI